MSLISIINDDQTEFDQRMSNFSLHHEQFEEIQYERNYLNTMVKIAEVNDVDDQTIVVEANGNTALKIDDNGTYRGYEFNKVFSPDETSRDVFNYVKYYGECVLDGEDCNIIGYGGRKTRKSKTLYGRKGDNNGITTYLLNYINELMELRNIEGRLTMSMFLIDNKDSVYDAFGQDKPTPFSLRISKEKYLATNAKEFKSDILDTSLLTRILIDDIPKAINFIISRLTHVSLKGKVGASLLSIYFDGEDINRIISGRLNIVEILDSEWLTRSTISSNPFHTLLSDLVNNNMIKYVSTNLTYLLRDSLCKYVRTTLIGFVFPTLEMIEKTKSTISVIGSVYKKGNLVDFGEPSQRQIYKFYENDKLCLQRLYTQFKADNSYLSEQISEFIESKYGEHKSRMINLKTEIDLAKSMWNQEIDRLTNDKADMKEQQKKYREQQIYYYNARLKVLNEKELLEKRYLEKLDEIDQINTTLDPIKYEAEKVNEELLPLRQKSNDLQRKIDDVNKQLNEIRTELATIDENNPRRRNANRSVKTVTTTTTTTVTKRTTSTK